MTSTTDLSKLREELLALLEKATPGPWKVESYYDSQAFETFWTVSCSDGRYEMSKDNADLIVYLRNNAQAICDALAELEKCREDKERIDWLERFATGRWDGTIGRPKRWLFHGWPFNKLDGNTLREAIDTAMRQEGK